MTKCTTKNKVRQVMDELVARFESGDVPAALAVAIIRPPKDRPCSRWSFHNRVLQSLEGTADARGYRQWQQVGRQVKKGAKAFTILGPRMVTETKEDKRTHEEVKRSKLIGFVAIPVFRYEDTEGEALPGYEPPEPPPLEEVAARLGVTVSYAGSDGGTAGGYWVEEKKIVLASHDPSVYLHELAHAAHYQVEPTLKPTGEDPYKEIVAELSAAALARLYLPADQQNLGYKRGYIAYYAKRQEITLAKACLNVLATVGKVLALILDQQQDDAQTGADAA